MKISVICLGYLQIPSGVDTLARYFSKINADVYLHIDAKVSSDYYQEALKNNANIMLLPDRFPIWWGGFNTVRAIVAALKCIRNIRHYDRYLLLTEDTVPLLSPEALANHLQQDFEFIDSYPVPLQPDHLVRQRYAGWYLFDSIATNPRHYPPEQRVFDDELLASTDRLNQLRKKGKRPLPNLRGGSTWWGLSNEAISSILELYENSEWLRASFEYAAIPEEMIFQTLLGMSEQKRAYSPFLLTDFSKDPKPYVFSTESELTSLVGGPHCMVRKVDLRSAGVNNYMESLIEGSI